MARIRTTTFTPKLPTQAQGPAPGEIVGAGVQQFARGVGQAEDAITAGVAKHFAQQQIDRADAQVAKARADLAVEEEQHWLEADPANDVPVPGTSTPENSNTDRFFEQFVRPKIDAIKKAVPAYNRRGQRFLDKSIQAIENDYRKSGGLRAIDLATETSAQQHREKMDLTSAQVASNPEIYKDGIKRTDAFWDAKAEQGAMSPTAIAKGRDLDRNQIALSALGARMIDAPEDVFEALSMTTEFDKLISGPQKIALMSQASNAMKAKGTAQRGVALDRWNEIVPASAGGNNVSAEELRKFDTDYLADGNADRKARLDRQREVALDQNTVYTASSSMTLADQEATLRKKIQDLATSENPAGDAAIAKTWGSVFANNTQMSEEQTHAYILGRDPSLQKLFSESLEAPMDERAFVNFTRRYTGAQRDQLGKVVSYLPPQASEQFALTKVNLGPQQRAEFLSSYFVSRGEFAPAIIAEHVARGDISPAERWAAQAVTNRKGGIGIAAKIFKATELTEQEWSTRANKEGQPNLAADVRNVTRELTNAFATSNKDAPGGSQDTAGLSSAMRMLLMQQALDDRADVSTRNAQALFDQLIGSNYKYLDGDRFRTPADRNTRRIERGTDMLHIGRGIPFLTRPLVNPYKNDVFGFKGMDIIPDTEFLPGATTQARKDSYVLRLRTDPSVHFAPNNDETGAILVDMHGLPVKTANEFGQSQVVQWTWDEVEDWNPSFLDIALDAGKEVLDEIDEALELLTGDIDDVTGGFQ